MVVQGQVQLINCSEQPLPQLQGMNQNQKLFLDLTRSASRQGPCSNYVQPDPSPTQSKNPTHTTVPGPQGRWGCRSSSTGALQLPADAPQSTCPPYCGPWM